MKKLIFLSLVALSGTLMFSCEKEEIPGSKETADLTAIAVDEVLQAVTIDDIQITVDQFSGFGEGFLKSGTTVEETTCPVITVEKLKADQDWPRKVTLDFGTGCTKNGKQISGKIIMVKTGPWLKPGTARDVTFENYTIDKVKVAGEKHLANLTELGGKVTFGIRTNMTLTTTDETGKLVKVVNRKEERKQVWLIDFTKFEIGMGRDFMAGVGFEFSGTSKVKTQKDGQEMMVEKKTNGVLVKMGCMFPQAGVVEIAVKNFDGKESKFKLDYATKGNGTNCQPNCDCIATLTVGDTSKDIDLTEKWRQQIPNK